MSLFTDVVTLYSYRRDGRADAWEKTILRGVQLSARAVHTMTDNGTAMVTMETRLTVPFDVDSGRKAYVSPSDFETAERGKYWTLSASSGQDMIVPGEGPELSEACTANDLRHKHGAVIIRSASDNTARTMLKHWRATGI